MSTTPTIPGEREPRYTPEVARRTADVLERVRSVVPEMEWPVHAPYVDAIREWKAKRNAVVLAHNYQTPEIFHGVADLKGDSLALARMAAETDADVIVMAGVHFMAETAKILNPEKTVLIPDLEAGCSLAESITAADVRLLRERYPGAPVVTYVNTSAAVKAESDVCCTSANAVEVVESLKADRVIFLPDEYLGRYVASKTDIEIILWKGHCEVHERFTGTEIREYRRQHPGIAVLAHPECPPDVLEAGLRGLDLGPDPAPGGPPAVPGGAHHRVLDERQRGGRVSRDRVHSSLQPVPAHEEDHPAEHPAGPPGDGAPGGGRPRRGRSGPRRRGADAGGGAGARPMSPTLDGVRDADVVVIGAGAAGLSVALGLEGRSVDLLAKGPLSKTGNSPLAQGGVAGAVGPDDSPGLHAADTLAVGGAVGDPEAVARLTTEGPARLSELIELGARFDRGPGGELDLAREAAHSRERILHARDATGAEIVRALRAGLGRLDGLTTFEESFALDLVLDAGRLVGVLVRHQDGALVLHRARAVVLATGGIGQVYARTTNPLEATGDGLALAWRAGARLGDLEFVQFHPTALDTGDDPMPLLTEALRGEGARLVDESGAPIFDVPGGELQARDVVARGIWTALARGRRPLLDAREAVGESFPERFPTVFESCRAHGLDPRVEPMPVAPAAHYHMGGVLVDADGRTSRPGLVGGGRGRLHRCARRQPPGQQLAPGGAGLRGPGGALGGRVAVAKPPGRPPRAPRDLAVVAEPGPGRAQVARVRQLMWERAGLVRTGDGLRDGLDRLAVHEAELPVGASEARNLLTVARLVARAALSRPESRGAHFRADHPDTRTAWRRRLVLTRGGDGDQVSFEPASSPPARRHEASA